MRQRTDFFREMRSPRILPPLGLRGLGLYGGAGLLLAYVGAFDTGGTSWPVRSAYFVGLCLAAGGIVFALEWQVKRGRFGYLPGFARQFAIVGATSIALTPLVWLAAALVLDGEWSPTRLAPLAGQVVPVTALLIGLHRLASADQPPAAETSTEPLRLPRRALALLHGEGLLAIRAEDHYLRVYRVGGSTLVLMRFADALRAVENFDGAQTHRSWWVSRNAIAAVRRGDGRATLSLVNDVTVPVSRRYVRGLRRLGWF